MNKGTLSSKTVKKDKNISAETGDMFIIYLASNFRPFVYKGYTDLSQLGKYFALTY